MNEMNLIKLDNIWKTFSEDIIKSEFEYKLISTNTIPLLNIGKTENGYRCLVLEIPKTTNLDFPESIKEHIELRFYKIESCLCIILKDNLYIDLFDDLTLSIFYKIYKIKEPNEYCKQFVEYFYKWVSFFEKNQSQLLDKETIQGVFGELLFLQYLMNNRIELPIDEVLNAWKGLDGTSHDFIFEKIDYEVKTIQSHINQIKISSEYQLECTPGKKLELIVIEVIDDTEHGKPISKLVEEIRALSIEKFADNYIVINLLLKKGITIHNIKNYDLWKFTKNKICFFDCINPEFPRIIKSKTPIEISNIKYGIRLSLIQEFLIKEIK
jgi:hypothetical protein